MPALNAPPKHRSLALFCGLLAAVALGAARPAPAQEVANAEAELHDAVHRSQWMATGALLLGGVGLLLGLAAHRRNPAKGLDGVTWEESDTGPRLRLSGSGGTLSVGFDGHGGPAVHWCDTRGEARARFALAPDDTPYIEFNDEEGRNRLSLGLSEGGNGGLGLYDEKGISRAALGSGPDSTANLSFLDTRGNGRLRLGMGNDDVPELLLNDAEGQIRGVLRLRADGMVLIELSDAEGRVRTAQGALEDGTALLGLFGTDGALSAGLVIDPEDRAELNLDDPTNGPRRR